MSTFLKLLAGLLLLTLGFAAFSFHLYHSPHLGTTKTVFIESKTGAQALLEQLHDEQVIPPVPLIALPILLTRDYKSLKAGEYEFTAGSTPSEVIGRIIRGEAVVHRITIPEGWTSYQIKEALLKEKLLTGELPATIPEGSLLPDTMHFARGETRASVIERMQKAQQELLAELWTTRAENLPLQTPEEAIILASIIEKETGVADERKQVAGVYINRLRQGMKLQSDPTVAYGIEAAKGGAPMGRLLSRNDLARDTRYNSYTREGLPPTPICHPGRAALEAALDPATTDALYFVATGTGGHRFSATMKEHEKNVRDYRKTQRADDPEPVAKPAKKVKVAKAKPRKKSARKK